MIDGKYTIKVDTPLGKRPGTVILKTQGDVFYADIDAPVVGKQKTEGTVKGNTFATEGTFKLKLFGKVSYKLYGKVDGNKLEIVIDSSKGQIKLDGVRA